MRKMAFLPNELIELTRHPKVVALGEAGLDYFYQHGSREAQERGFRAHIAAARSTGLPLVIHTRDADEDCGRILEDEMAKGSFRAVLHCYTGGRDLAMKAISLGLSISFTGILTFKKSQALRDLAAELPADRIMVETDAPYLAPGKFRGKRNEPGLRRGNRQGAGGNAWRFAGRDIASDNGKLLPPVQQGAARGRRGMTLTLTILGCGSSAGVPRPALGWGACDPNNPKNRRRRCSLLVERTTESGTTRVVIDTSPDLREQLIDANVDHIDAVFLTHEHADQTHGIDDLRSVVLHQRRRIPVYLNQSTAEHILLRFSYCFVSPPGSDYPPILDSHPIEAGESRTIAGKGGSLALSAFILQHGNIPALGYRIGDAAYTPDVNDIPPRELARAGKSRPLDHRRAALRRTPQPFQRQRCAVMDRPVQAETRGHHQHAFGPGLRGAASQPAAECDSGL